MVPRSAAALQVHALGALSGCMSTRIVPLSAMSRALEHTKPTQPAAGLARLCLEHYPPPDVALTAALVIPRLMSMLRVVARGGGANGGGIFY